MVSNSTIDAIKWVKSKPSRFFNTDEPDPVRLLAYIMADVLELGGGECRIRSIGDWWVIGSDVAWLTHQEYPVSELFKNVVPAPQHGEHSMRGEVLVGAFAKDVAVVSGGTTLS